MNLENITKLLKKKNNQILLIILIIGVVMIFATGEKEKEEDVISEGERLEQILSDIKGVGRVSVMITYRENIKNGREEKEAKGVLITADGADIPFVKSEISDAACAVLDLPIHKVCVFKKQ